MKNFRLTFLVLSIAVVFVIASILWRALHTEGGVESVGCGYGNLWIQYAWHDRGLLRSSKVDWLIVMPEFPKHKEYDSLNGWRFRFENGRKFEFQPDRSNVIWVDPTNGPRKIPTELTKDLIKKIEGKRDEVKGHRFDRPDDFLTSIATGTQNKPVESSR